MDTNMVLLVNKHC